MNLNAHLIGIPMQIDKNPMKKVLKPDGSNLAEFLKQEFRTAEELAIVIDKLKYILPYLTDIQTSVSTDISDTIFLEMTESGRFKVPGWLLSTGAVRALVILTVLNKKIPPSVIFIEEIENGLDPRTIGLLISEFQRINGNPQIIITTHSPYLLDLLDLSHVIVVEKDENSKTSFSKPDNNKDLGVWKEKYSPGQLYIKGKLN